MQRKKPRIPTQLSSVFYKKVPSQALKKVLGRACCQVSDIAPHGEGTFVMLGGLYAGMIISAFETGGPLHGVQGVVVFIRKRVVIQIKRIRLR